MTAALDRYRRLTDGFTDRVQHTPTDRWDAEAPVPGWTARDVVGHLTGWLPPFLAGGAGVELRPGPSAEQDPVADWTTMNDQLIALLGDPETEAISFTNPHTGSMPLPQAVLQFFAGDVFLHAWDLARATGQDETLDPELVGELLAGMEPLDDLLRSSGQYGPKVEVPADADPQTRLLAFIGRDPLAAPAVRQRPDVERRPAEEQG